MTVGPDENPRRRLTWRVGTPAVFLLCGGLFVVSATNSEGTDLRPGRYTDLASLVSNETREVEALNRRVADLNAEVTELTEQLNDRTVNRIQREVRQMRDPAGLMPRAGEGVAVTLSDAPPEVIERSDRDFNLLVVHQQDIQAVVNAMWRGGATAVTIAGQRVVSTTGIKCEGNSVQLQGVPYPQPYVIEAVGDQTAILDALASDPSVSTYREQSEIPDIAIGWKLEARDHVEAPAFDGLIDMNHATPIT